MYFIFTCVFMIITFQEDVDLMKKLNFDAYRFSISWSRIFPGILVIIYGLYFRSRFMLCNFKLYDRGNR